MRVTVAGLPSSRCFENQKNHPPDECQRVMQQMQMMSIVFMAY